MRLNIANELLLKLAADLKLLGFLLELRHGRELKPPLNLDAVWQRTEHLPVVGIHQILGLRRCQLLTGREEVSRSPELDGREHLNPPKTVDRAAVEPCQGHQEELARVAMLVSDQTVFAQIRAYQPHDFSLCQQASFCVDFSPAEVLFANAASRLEVRGLIASIDQPGLLKLCVVVGIV